MKAVTALYVDPLGPYPKLVADWYDEKRDARTYAGPNPVVAHPPCGPWGPMRGLCTKQDRTLAPLAVEAVRKWGGVLEHPRYSLLFRHCSMPLPGELPDAYGGRTYEVHQVSWGHQSDKPTWLYVVGVDASFVVSGIRTGGVATHRITSGPGGSKLPSCTKKKAARSPVAFAEWLISIAERAKT